MLTSSSMTKADIRKRVALRAKKIAQDTSSGQIIADDTEPGATMLDDAIRDGVEEFWDDHQWSFSSRIIQFSMDAAGTGPLNIDSDPSRYILPDDVRSAPVDNVAYIRSPDSTTGWEIGVRHMDQVVEKQFMSSGTSGLVEVCAVEFNPNVRPGMDQRGGFELRVWPTPGDDYEIAFRAMVAAVPLVEDGQRGNWPAAHDKTVVACAVRCLMRHDQAPGSDARKQAELDAIEALEKSKQYDDENGRPPSLGSLGEKFGPRSHLTTVTDGATGQVFLSTTTFG